MFIYGIENHPLTLSGFDEMLWMAVVKAAERVAVLEAEKRERIASKRF